MVTRRGSIFWRVRRWVGVVVENFRRRLWAKALVAAFAAAGSFGLVAWFAWARPLVAETISKRLGYQVQLGQLYPAWSQGNVVLVARDLVIMGQAPFHKEPLAVCDRVEIQPGNPPTVWVDGLELRLLVAPSADNVRGARSAKRASPGTAHAHTMRQLPFVHVRSGRLQAQIALFAGKRMSLRAGDVRFANRGRAFDLHVENMTAEVANVATAHLSTLEVEGTTSGDVLLKAENLKSRLPGGSPLFEGLALDGTLREEGISLTAKSRDTANANLEVNAQAGAGGVSVQVEMENWPLLALAPMLDTWGIGSHASHANGVFEAQLDPGETVVSWRVDGKVRNLSLHHPAVDNAVWDASTVALEAQGRLDWLHARLEVAKARLLALGLPLDLSGWITLGAQPSGSWSLGAPAGGWPCETLTKHLAPSVRKALWGLNMRGKLEVAADVTFDAADWDKLVLDLRLPSTCRVAQEPQTLAQNLNALQTASAGLATRPELPLAPDHASFTPLQKIPVHLISAFLTAEDAGFFLHKGFEHDNIRKALIYNIERGRFVRGASTITQQVAKNLFLNHERTLTRKFVEAVLAWRLDELVAKRRVLEMYLNLVELGPGIRGVGEASRAYFGKEPGALTPLEAAHLASLPPNPQGFARRFREGSVDEGWLARLYDLVGMMGRRGLLSPAQVATARGSRLRLRKI